MEAVTDKSSKTNQKEAAKHMERPLLADRRTHGSIELVEFRGRDGGDLRADRGHLT